MNNSSKFEMCADEPISFSTTDNKRTISGYAAVFYDPANPGSTYKPEKNVELRIHRGAFDSVLRNPGEIQALLFHDWNRPIGALGQNMRLGVDTKGLRYEIDLPNNHDGKDAWESVGGNGGPRLIRGMSFTSNRGFDKWSKENNVDVLTFYRWDSLDEITLTNKPAFVGTSVSFSADLAKFVQRERQLEYVRKINEQIGKK